MKTYIRAYVFVALFFTGEFSANAGEEAQGPVSLEASYVAEIWYNSGGLNSGGRYLDSLSLAANFDLEPLWAWQGADAHISLLYNNGETLSELTGDSLIVSNIEAGEQAVRLYELWLDVPISEHASLRFGKYDLNSEFDVLDASSMFVGSAHGIGMDIGQAGENGPSIFPITGLAARLEFEILNDVTFRAAALDGVPGDPGNPRVTQLQISRDEGALLIGELAIEGDQYRVLGGVWSFTDDFTTHDGSGEERSQGVYLRGETRILDMPSGGLSGFFRGGIASGRVNQFDTFASAGIIYDLETTGTLGAAIAYAGASDLWRDSNPSGGANETVIELTYSHRLTDWLTIQPNLQFVSNLGSLNGTDDAVAGGVRFTANSLIN